MYSLLYSLLITLVIFGVAHYIEKGNIEQKGEIYDMQKHLITSGNAILFFMIFITSFVLVYFAFDDGDLLTSLGIYEDDHKRINIKDPVYDVKKSNTIDPTILKRINDPLKYGFEPYSGGSDMSSSDISDGSNDSNDSDGSNDSNDSDSSNTSSSDTSSECNSE
jgi:hypothetical protein